MSKRCVEAKKKGGGWFLNDYRILYFVKYSCFCFVDF